MADVPSAPVPHKLTWVEVRLEGNARSSRRLSSSRRRSLVLRPSPLSGPSITSTSHLAEVDVSEMGELERSPSRERPSLTQSRSCSSCSDATTSTSGSASEGEKSCRTSVLSSSTTINGGPSRRASMDNTWYIKTPYDDVPKFTRLGLAGSNVVMPHSVKEHKRRTSSNSLRSTSLRSSSAPTLRQIPPTPSIPVLSVIDEAGPSGETQDARKRMSKWLTVFVCPFGDGKKEKKNGRWWNRIPIMLHPYVR